VEHETDSKLEERRNLKGKATAQKLKKSRPGTRLPPLSMTKEENLARKLTDGR